ncbi:hypothetical protein WP50_03740, partial [Lactiplantibacillus plantarum]
MLLPGSPCIYYGTEVAMAGGADPDNRRCMNWQPDEQEQQVRQFVTRLIKFRRQQADFLATSQLTWTIDGHCLILTRTDVEQTIQGRFNLGATKFKSALTLLMLLPGSPCIYYGTEVAMAGGADPDNRRCMNWQPDEQEQQVRQFVTRLI